MKKPLLAILIIIFLAILNILVIDQKSSRYTGFPHVENLQNEQHKEATFFLYLFFSKNNCIKCLEIIPYLNTLPPQFVVIGLIPREELEELSTLRQMTGAKFDIQHWERYWRFIPPYKPALVGVSPKGRLFFVLPAVPEQIDYLDTFLTNFYLSAKHHFSE